jgi:hypothetical protein
MWFIFKNQTTIEPMRPSDYGSIGQTLAKLQQDAK